MALRDLLLSIITSVAVATGAMGSSQTSTSESSSLPPITVTAPRPPTPQELAGEAVPHFVESHAIPSIVIHQLTRWRVNICPITLGLSPAMNNFVSARIAAIVEAVGAPHQTEAQCKPNLLVLFANEPQRELEEVVKALGPRVLGFHYPQQTKRLMTFDRPVQGWYVTSTRNFKGVEVNDDPLPMPAPSAICFCSPVPGGEPGSRLTTLRVSLIVNAVALVDANKVRGLSVQSISDYLAVLVLSQSKSPDTCGQLPSIIDLMASNCDSREKPTQITAGDLAFLRALYTMNLEESLELEQSTLEDHMMRQFESFSSAVHAQRHPGEGEAPQ
jgi:hypothetical protein